MSRPDSIRAKGLEKHVNEYCLKHSIPFRYRHLVEWLEQGDEVGDRMPTVKLAKLFGTTRHTMEKWISIYNEEKRKA